MSSPYRDASPQPGASGSYFCPTCGRTVARTARSCPECGNGIATVRCAGCFHMNVPDNALCEACGEALGLEPFSEPSGVSCARCLRPFEVFRGGPGALYDCGECGGQFVEHPLLRDLLERRERYGDATPRRPRRYNPGLDAVVYVKCPVCQVQMNRQNFGRSSGVVVDVCAPHGTWFDAGELPRVMKFVETGGLAEARRLAEEARKLAAVREKTRKIEDTFSRLSHPVVYPETHGAVVDAALGLLSMIDDFLGG